MMRLLLCCWLSLLIQSALGQCADSTACNYDPNGDPSTGQTACLILEPHVVHTAGALSGQTTYRLYVFLPEPDVFLSAISTIIDETLDPNLFPGQATQIHITTTTGFHQDPVGSVAATGILPSLLDFFPNLLYDSWVTIGHAPEDGMAAATVGTIYSPNQNWVAAFEAGGDLVMDDIIGGLWYIYNDGNDQGVPDADGKVLIAQLTTDGDIGVSLSGQYFPDYGSGPNGEADGTADIQFISELGPPCPNDPNAGCVYPDPERDCDGNCLVDVDGDDVCDGSDPCVGTLDACGVCNGPGAIYACGCADVPIGDCDCDGNELDALGVCGGPCAADADGDGLCDDVDDCVGAYDECGVCNGPGAVLACGCEGYPAGTCDCDGNTLDAIGLCGGDCTADVDADGLCDDVDPCIGAYDACGQCNGPGAIYDCGCSDLPSGACDCDGNQLDAIGVCGGDCEADVDADGICDDVDPCVGAFDACGICNGPGAIYDCGCSGIPSGDCDCEGNTLDAINVCGGACTADVDADGICDDVDPCIGAYDACGVCNGVGDLYQCGCANIPEGDCDCNGNQLDALGVCGGGCASDADGDGICDDIVQGCTYPEALNYVELAVLDDGTCSFPAPPEPDDCPKDLDGDELIGVGDILALLADFGMSCP